MKTSRFFTLILATTTVMLAGCTKENLVKVSGVSLNSPTLTLVEGDSETLVATVAPSDADNKAVTWKSDKTDIATVDANGKVTAVKTGTAVITVTTTDGGETATCTVTVSSEFLFADDAAYDIPAMTAGVAITEIDLSDGASGGTAPYTFSATELPAGIAMSATGVISGTPTTVAEAGTATVTVEDSSSPVQSRQITIATGAVATNPTYDAGVVINGVTWASRAVGMPETFVATPNDAGMFYQWNRITAWSNTEPLKAYNTEGEEIVDAVWPNYNDFSTSWLPENDPSPAGWRIPTVAELRTLLDTEKVSSEWVAATETTPAGRLFTDIATGNTLFFCAGGTRSASSPNNGTLTRVGEAALWWSASNGTNNNQYKVSMRTIERIADITEGAVWGALPYNGYFIRSVKITQ